MQWWLIIYLIFLIGLEVFGTIDNLISKWGSSKVILSIFSGISKVLFVVTAYYNPALSGILYFIIPLILLTFMWDFYEIKRDFLATKNDDELSDKEFKIAISISIVSVVVIILPAYFAGGFIIYKNLIL